MTSRRRSVHAIGLLAACASVTGLGGGRASAAPLQAPTLSCQADARVLDWDQNAWAQSSLAQSYAVDGTPLDFTITGDTNRFQTLNTTPPYFSPETNDLLGGGYDPRQQTVFLFVNNETNQERVQVRMRVGEPGIGVAAVQVPFFDVDVTDANTPYGFQDSLRAQGFLNGQPVNPTGRTTSLFNEPSGADTIIGRDGGAPSNGTNAERGTAIFTFDTPVDEVLFTYGSGPQTQANPAQQGIGVHDVTFCHLTDRADAPASYGTPTHRVKAGIFIGTRLPDHEPAARHSADARGDDVEGGETETAWPALYPDETRSLTVPVSGAGGRLSAWVDWNRDGVFGIGEKIATDVRDTDGDGQITLDVQTPENTALGQTYARLRWTTAAGATAISAAPDGEVEDARVTITTPPPTGGPAAPLPPLACPARETRLDWDDPAYAWPQGADTQSYVVGGTAFAVARSYSNGRASDTRPGTWPRTGIGKTGGLQPPQQTLRIGPNMTNDAHSTTMRIDVGRPGVGVEAIQFEVFDLDASSPGPNQAREKLRVVGYLDGAQVAPPNLTTNANTVDEGGGVGGGTAPSDSSAAGTLGVTFSQRVDRIDLIYGARNEGRPSPNQSIGLHDLRYCAPLDFGDAPASYASASHRITPGLRIGGVAPDAEVGMQRSAGADGDDQAGADDETDGLFPALIAGGTVTIDVPVTEPSPGTAYLQAWIDWAGDGSFAQTGDRIAADRRDRNADGTVTLSVRVPANAKLGDTVARLRWSTRTSLGRGGEAPDGEVEDHAVTITAAGARRVTGRVLIDDGRGGGTAHDGTANGGEVGRAGRSVVVTDASGTTLATLTTNGEGRFTYVAPDGMASGTALTFDTQPGPGFVSVSKSRNGNATLGTNGRIANVTLPASGDKAIVFGQVPEATLTASRAQQVEPGGVAAFTHRYAPGTAGTVAFALGAAAGPAANAFSGTLVLDADCDGQVSASEGPPPASLAVAATDEVCLIVRVAADPGAQEGAAASLPLSAVLTRANGAGTATSTNDDRVTVARDGGATLTKEVCNADRASCDLATGAGFTAQNGGAPGERLVYRIVFTAAGANAVRGVTITDTTPLYSSLVAETVRVASAPPALSCTVTPASGTQAAGYTGPVEWRCTGDLAPGAEGVAAFEVRIDP